MLSVHACFLVQNSDLKLLIPCRSWCHSAVAVGARDEREASFSPDLQRRDFVLNLIGSAHAEEAEDKYGRAPALERMLQQKEHDHLRRRPINVFSWARGERQRHVKTDTLCTLCTMALCWESCKQFYWTRLIRVVAVFDSLRAVEP